MSTLTLLRIGACSMAFLGCVGVCTDRPALTWCCGQWGFFLFAEAVGFKTHGTYSGFMWFLFRANLLGMCIASTVSAVMTWAATWHFVIEFNLFPKLRGSLHDDEWYVAIWLCVILTLSAIGFVRSGGMRSGPKPPN